MGTPAQVWDMVKKWADEFKLDGGEFIDINDHMHRLDEAPPQVQIDQTVDAYMSALGEHWGLLPDTSNVKVYEVKDVMIAVAKDMGVTTEEEKAIIVMLLNNCMMNCCVDLGMYTCDLD